MNKSQRRMIYQQGDFCSEHPCKYGIWNSVKKEFQFGISEDTPMLAEARLFQKIGDNALKSRFHWKKLPKEEK